MRQFGLILIEFLILREACEKFQREVCRYYEINRRSCSKIFSSSFLEKEYKSCAYRSGPQPRRFSCKEDYAAKDFPHFSPRRSTQINIFIRYLSRILFDARYLNMSLGNRIFSLFDPIKIQCPVTGTLKEIKIQSLCK